MDPLTTTFWVHLASLFFIYQVVYPSNPLLDQASVAAAMKERNQGLHRLSFYTTVSHTQATRVVKFHYLITSKCWKSILFSVLSTEGKNVSLLLVENRHTKKERTHIQNSIRGDIYLTTPSFVSLDSLSKLSLDIILFIL